MINTILNFIVIQFSPLVLFGSCLNEWLWYYLLEVLLFLSLIFRPAVHLWLSLVHDMKKESSISFLNMNIQLTQHHLLRLFIKKTLFFYWTEELPLPQSNCPYSQDLIQYDFKAHKTSLLYIIDISQWFSKCGPQTSSINIIQKLFRNVNSHPWHTLSEILVWNLPHNAFQPVFQVILIYTKVWESL